jgi:alpha-glucoside transport system substrate-binding protein
MQRKAPFMALFAATSIVLAACGSSQPAAPAPTTAPEAPAATTAPEAPAAQSAAMQALIANASNVSAELAAAFNGDYSGTIVTMTGPFADEDAVKFNNAIAEFESLTGIDIQYEGSREFEASISIRVDGGNPPDIVDFPQPGLLANFVRDGKVVDVSQFLSSEWLSQNYNQSWIDMTQMEGPDGPISAGVWHRVNGKSLVWYPKAAFEANGYTIPQTWDEMIALTDQIAADGDTAWCIGIESGAATGWAATDWMEEIMLRTTSLENYDAWVAGELDFASPEVTAAAEKMSEIWFNDEYVFGGRAAIVTTSFGDSPSPMFNDPPGCYLHKQGNFITSFFPPDAQAGVDYDFFYMPPIDESLGKPVLVAGDLMAMFNDRPEVRAVMSYFSSGASVEQWIRSGGAISAHNDSDLAWYSNDVDRGVAEIILNATSVRFDASDLMPGQVGAGSFWKGMTDYVAGTVDLNQAMTEIDSAWPAE